MKTLQQLAREALAVQNACNLSGVVHGFACALSDLRTALEAAGRPASTTDLNTHPIARVWADKIAHLTRTQAHQVGAFGDNLNQAYGVVHELASTPCDREIDLRCARYVR